METQEFVRRLKVARDLIATKGWTKGWYARNAKGEPVGERNVTATCYCAVGALRAAGLEWGQWKSECHATGWSFLDEFNDDPATKREHVLAMFDNSIAALEGK